MQDALQNHDIVGDRSKTSVTFEVAQADHRLLAHRPQGVLKLHIGSLWLSGQHLDSDASTEASGASQGPVADQLRVREQVSIALCMAPSILHHSWLQHHS